MLWLKKFGEVDEILQPQDFLVMLSFTPAMRWVDTFTNYFGSLCNHSVLNILVVALIHTNHCESILEVNNHTITMILFDALSQTSRFTRNSLQWIVH